MSKETRGGRNFDGNEFRGRIFEGDKIVSKPGTGRRRRHVDSDGQEVRGKISGGDIVMGDKIVTRNRETEPRRDQPRTPETHKDFVVGRIIKDGRVVRGRMRPEDIEEFLKEYGL